MPAIGPGVLTRAGGADRGDRAGSANRDDRGDAGFTLVELLIATVILGVITLGLGNVIIGYLRHADATSDRLTLSHDAQLSAAYFAQDVATVGVRDHSAGAGTGTVPPLQPSIQVNAAYNAGGRTCGTAATPTAIVRFLADRWADTGSAPTGTDIVTYYVTGTELHRIRCGAVNEPDIVLAHHVDPATVALTCSVTAGCQNAAVPQRVSLSFRVTKPGADPYDVSLTGQWRQT